MHDGDSESKRLDGRDVGAGQCFCVCDEAEKFSFLADWLNPMLSVLADYADFDFVFHDSLLWVEGW